MAQAPPLNITPNIPTVSPYNDPNNPYQAMNPVNSMVKALQSTVGGANDAVQGGASAPAAASASGAPNYGQFGQQMGSNLVTGAASLFGSTPAFGGGNLLSGDAYGGSAAAPLPGLSAADYG